VRAPTIHFVLIIASTIWITTSLRCSAASPQVIPPKEFELRPGVVVDLSRGQLYVMDPGGAISAVDLAQGREIWHTNQAAKPLALAGNLLISQADTASSATELKIVALDTENGGEQVLANSVSLPPGVVPSIDKTLRNSFVAHAETSVSGAAVTWEYTAQPPVSGVRPGGSKSYFGVPAGSSSPTITAAADLTARPERTGATRQISRGAFHLDLPSGSITPQQPDIVATAPAVPALTLSAAEQLKGVPKPQFLSADGRYILNSKRSANDLEWNKYVWTIYDRNGGQRIGQIKAPVSLAPFFVWNTRVIYEVGPYSRRNADALIEEPLQIRAVSLQTGEQVWSRPVRDTTPRGAPPP
jgi:hypothetical protein